VADRDDAAVLAVALNATGWVPVPVAPAVIVSQLAELAAVHAQPGPAVTVTDAVDAAAPIDALAVESTGVHGALPDCATVNGRPAIVSVAARPAVEVFPAALKSIRAVPLPDAGEVMVSHATGLLAVQSQTDARVTVTAPADAPDPSDTADGENVGSQVGENEKTFDGPLALPPDGPTAATRAW
jgi:hypothetical protein